MSNEVIFEIARAVGRIEEGQKTLRIDLGSYITAQDLKNKEFDDTHQFVKGVRSKLNFGRRLITWLTGLVIGRHVE